MQEEPSAGADRGKHIVRGLGSLTVQNLLTAILGFLLLAALTRYLAAPDYGTYSAVTVTVGIVVAVSTFGLGPAVVYFMASESGGEVAWGATKAALYITLALAGATSLAMVLAAPYLSAYFGKGAPQTWAYYLGAGYLFVSAVSYPFQSALQGMRKYGSLARVIFISRLVAVIFGIVGVAVYHSLAAGITSWVIYFSLIIVLPLPMLWRHLRRADPRPYYYRVMRYAYLLGIAGIVSTVAGSADIVVVGGYLSLTSLGVYNAAIQIASILSALFVAPLVTALFAETSLSSESEGELRQGTGLALRFALVTLLPASFLAAAMAPQLFDLFSGGKASFAKGIPYLELITLFYTFTAVQAMALNILQGVNRTRQVLIVGTVTAIGDVILSASLVPGFGLAGATFSRVAVFVTGCTLSLYFVRRYLPSPFEYRFLGKALLAAAIPAVVVYLASVAISDSIITLLPYALLGLAVFVSCAKAFRLLSAEDKSYLSHLLPGGLQWVLKLV